MIRMYRDRLHAGRVLADALEERGPFERPIVLALPRGGVPVGAVVAKRLGAPLDVMVVRKLGFPGQPEYAMGAIASGGAVVWNDEVMAAARLPEDLVQAVLARERRELERRERAYRGDRPRPDLRGRTVILVDDGVATGSTMLAALRAARQLGADRVVVAAPVAPPDKVARLARAADLVVVPLVPRDFRAVGQFYADFSQLTDEEVAEILGEPEPVSGPP